MEEGFLGLPLNWNGLGLGGLVLFFMYMLATGRLYFKWQVDRMFKDKDKLILDQQVKIEADGEVKTLIVKILTLLEEKAKVDD